MVVDAEGEVIVSGPTKVKAGSKTYTFKVTNNGTGPLTLDLGTAITGSVTVDGAPNGTVAGPTGTDTINPGKSVRYKLVWTHDALASGAQVVYSACVNAAGDMEASNDCGSATATASGPQDGAMGGQRAFALCPPPRRPDGEGMMNAIAGRTFLLAAGGPQELLNHLRHGGAVAGPRLLAEARRGP